MRIHDHFWGSAHCIECQGQCKLVGHERGITELVRVVVEDFAWRKFKKIPVFYYEAFVKLGLDPKKLLRRARPQLHAETGLRPPSSPETNI